MQSPIKTSATAEKIVVAAGKLFARQGYHGTSTREIARIAGVSENTLFRHFDNKEELFWSALLFSTKELKFRRDLQAGLARCDPPEVIFPKLFELLADTAAYKPELFRLIAVAFLELNSKVDAYCHEYVSPIVGTVSQYLAINMKKGIIADLDPTMLTAAFMMSAVMRPGLTNLLGGDNPAYAGGKDPARSYSKFWLDVLTARPVHYPMQATAFTTAAQSGSE